MSYFIFNDVSSSDLGIIVTEPVIRPTWGKEFLEIETAGSAVKFMQEKSNYKNSEFVIKTAVSDDDPIEMRNKIRSIYSVLNGFGKLWLSDSPEEYLNVIIQPLVPETKAFVLAEIPIYVTCQPFAYAVSPTIIQFSTETVEVPNNGTVFSYPEIKFTPTADDVTITVNGVDFMIKDLSSVGEQSLIGKEITVDNENHVTYFVDENNLKWAINDHTFNDYPRLHTGINYIMHSGNATNAQINVKERYL
ncbi:MAG: phage tail family protein [Ruminococcus sp.]|nr:phage tail family protein [Ruminococcus sp.]